jgi:signal transduction histidine kinase
MVRMIGAVEDITELKAAEEEIARKTAALEAANAALTEQTRLLEAQHEELQRLSRAKDEFLSVVSHELRTPLATIEGVLSLLERPGVDVDAYHRRIGIATRHLTSLVNDLLSAAQLQAGRFEMTSRPFQPEQLLEDAYEEVEPLAQAKGVLLRRHVDGALPQMTGDRYRLLQVLRNLLHNAVRHTGSGGEVCLGARVEAEQLRIDVADTGDGLDEAAQAHLFERFATTRSHGGVGLGLYIVKQLVEAHGGQVVVESEREVGTTFTVSLPIS